MKYVLIVNPFSGNGEAEKTVREAVQKSGLDCEILLTKTSGDATELVKNYPTDGETVLFCACGGDGTANEVANGVVGKENAAFAVYPCGSGNDFVKAFGGAEKFADLKTVLTSPLIPVDAMSVNGKICINVCDFGFDAVVGRTANEVKEKGGKDPYGAGVRKAIFTGMNNKATVAADGEVLNPKGTYLLCTVANGKYVGGKFQCAPKSNPSDGWLDVCLFDKIGLFKFLSILNPYTEGKHLDGDKKFAKITHYKQAKQVTVQADKEIDVCVDGEMIKGNAFVIDVLPGAVLMAVPTEA